MANFTPQQIEEILQAFFNVTGKRQYVGARYVPIFGRKNEDSIEWDNSGAYEPLTIVYYEGDSYTSRRYVPAGVDISDAGYWVITGRYNAQVEQYRQEVVACNASVANLSEDLDDVKDAIPYDDFSASNTVKEYIDSKEAEIRAGLDDSFLPWPDSLHYPKFGTLDQVLATLANGETKWVDPVEPTDEQANTYISQWLNNHPEATTTVQNGSITPAKFADSTNYSYLHYLIVTSDIATSSFGNSLDNVPSGIYAFISTSWFNDFPASVNGITLNTPCWIISAGTSGGTIGIGFQILIFPNNNNLILIRTKLNNASWSNWKLINDPSYAPFGRDVSSIIGANGSLNDLSANGIFYSPASNTFADVPNSSFNSSAFIIECVKSSSVITQTISNITGGKTRVFRRWKLLSGGSFSSWQSSYIEESSIATSKFDSNVLNTFVFNRGIPSIESINDLTTAGLWYIPSPTTITDLPIESPLHILVVINGVVTFQYAIQATSGRLLVRYKVGENDWRDWNEHEQFPINKNGRYYAFGDSTTRGQVGGVEYTNTPYGYPKITADYLGLNVTNLAVGGQGLCKDWETINTTISNTDMSDATLITVGWAYNDSATWATMNRGNYQSNDDTTVIGRYFTIMKTLQEKCPTAQLILVTGYGAPSSVEGHATLNNQFTGTYTFLDQSCTVREFYDELEKMANYNSWPCVNQAKGCALNKYNASRLIGDQVHPTVEGYWVYGNNLAAQIGKYYANIKPRGF